MKSSCDRARRARPAPRRSRPAVHLFPHTRTPHPSCSFRRRCWRPRHGRWPPTAPPAPPRPLTCRALALARSGVRSSAAVGHVARVRKLCQDAPGPRCRCAVQGGPPRVGILGILGSSAAAGAVKDAGRQLPQLCCGHAVCWHTRRRHGQVGDDRGRRVRVREVLEEALPPSDARAQDVRGSEQHMATDPRSPASACVPWRQRQGQRRQGRQRGMPPRPRRVQRERWRSSTRP